MHICIPTKGRFHTKTYRLLEQAGLPFTHFVEPQEESLYLESKVPNLQVIGKNDQGVAYVRNWIIRFAQKKGWEWVWVVDDDVSGFGTAKNGKTIKGTAQVLSDFYEKVKQYRFPVNGLNYCQYAWSYSTKGKRYAINKRPAEVCVLLYVPKITWEYRDDRKEDRDFTMLAIKHSDGVIVDLHAWFNCPGVGTNPGGLQHLYLEKRDTHWANKLVKDWSPFAKLIKKKERIDCKLDISGYAKSLNRIVR